LPFCRYRPVQADAGLPAWSSLPTELEYHKTSVEKSMARGGGGKGGGRKEPVKPVFKPEPLVQQSSRSSSQLSHLL
jgi:hypothetical protein